MNVIRVVTVVGARPQFVKAAAIGEAIAAFNAAGGGVRIEQRIVHTGQHYDANMSKIFFDELGIQPPVVNLGVGSGRHGAQTAAMLEGIERILVDERPNWLLIYGDTNSTLAGALAAAKLHIPSAHVEAGLRSFNRAMPEEINRIVADHLAELLLCPTSSAVRNLADEGIRRNVHLVGDVMYDSMLRCRGLARHRSNMLDPLGLKPKEYYLATLHRAENTDDPTRLSGILTAFSELPHPIVLPLHPRTRKMMESSGVRPSSNVRIIEPVGYLDVIRLEAEARIILTDSGGMQKEAYWLDVPCVTLRDETEWVELVEAGCNVLVGADRAAIVAAVSRFESAGAAQPANCPGHLYGDGHSSEKIVGLLANDSH